MISTWTIYFVRKVQMPKWICHRKSTSTSNHELSMILFTEISVTRTVLYGEIATVLVAGVNFCKGIEALSYLKHLFTADSIHACIYIYQYIYRYRSTYSIYEVLFLIQRKAKDNKWIVNCDKTFPMKLSIKESITIVLPNAI